MVIVSLSQFLNIIIHWLAYLQTNRWTTTPWIVKEQTRYVPTPQRLEMINYFEVMSINIRRDPFVVLMLENVLLHGLKATVPPDLLHAPPDLLHSPASNFTKLA